MKPPPRPGWGVVTIENHLKTGGLGTAVSEVMAENKIAQNFTRVGIDDTYTHGASKMYLMKKYNLGAEALIQAVEKVTGKKFGIKDEELEQVRFEDYSAV